jgi:K+-sensing histidine kinase KdpD
MIPSAPSVSPPHETLSAVFASRRAPLIFEHAGWDLGLSSAGHLVGIHGGTIRASSDGPGKGATFRVQLPRGEEQRTINSAHGQEGRV